MRHATNARPLQPETPARSRQAPRALLYKSDRPRDIDRYIDYFEGTAPGRRRQDACGERLLESLA